MRDLHVYDRYGLKIDSRQQAADSKQPVPDPFQASTPSLPMYRQGEARNGSASAVASSSLPPAKPTTSAASADDGSDQIGPNPCNSKLD